MKSIVSFGEVMLRLGTPGHQRFEQAGHFVAQYTGGEANVTCALAQWGIPSKHVTVFPDNSIGRAAASYLARTGLDVKHVVFNGERVGVFFLETGAGPRAGRIVYDRKHSAFDLLDPSWFGWDKIFEDAQWFHFTGITPAISANAAKACLDAVKAAKQKGLTVSSDINFRSNLWRYGKKPSDVMPELISHCNVIVAGFEDVKAIYNIEFGGENALADMCSKLQQTNPGLKAIISTKRGSVNASHNKLTGFLWVQHNLYQSAAFDIVPIVDRVGGGDAFMAGYIYGALQKMSEQPLIDFATAASVLKHTIEGDVDWITINEIETLAAGDGSGKLKR
jgi:2-dehydro-3-deoxygluconokinase